MSQSFSAADNQWMARAIALAKQGLYTTTPNPRVGCTIVRDGKLLGEGYHHRAGEGHAEVNALAAAGDVTGATAYVTLEPCSHTGRTPPCSRALINAGVARVVCAMVDPNPQVAGRGIAMLREAGIEVEHGLLEAQARELNPGFIKRMTSSRPYVRIKLAMSLDGRTAMASGESQWITGAEARSDVQRLRAQSCAIVTGIGTVLHDDASLTVREAELGLDPQLAADICTRQPLRLVLDSRGQLPEAAKIRWQPGSTIHVVANENIDSLGLEQWCLAADNRSIDLSTLLDKLAEQQCNEVLVEAGAELAGAFVAAGLCDELVVYMAPTLLGSSARPLLNLPLDKMAQQQRLTLLDSQMIGDDLKLRYRFER